MAVVRGNGTGVQGQHRWHRVLRTCIVLRQMLTSLSGRRISVIQRVPIRDDASYRGSSQNGTVFKVNTNGSIDLRNLHSFAALVSGTNSDGDYAYGTLISSGNTLYGDIRPGVVAI